MKKTPTRRGLRLVGLLLSHLSAAFLLSCAGRPPEDEAARGVDRAKVPQTPAEGSQRPGAVGSGQLNGPLDVVRGGGVAGYDDHIVIHPTGRVERVRGAEAIGLQVDPAMLRQLADALAGLEGVESAQPEIGADRMTYTVHYQGRRLHFDALTKDARLAPLRDVIQRLFSH